MQLTELAFGPTCFRNHLVFHHARYARTVFSSSASSGARVQQFVPRPQLCVMRSRLSFGSVGVVCANSCTQFPGNSR